MLAFQIYDSYGGTTMLGDYSSRATALTFGTNEHGFATLQATIPMSAQEAFRLYDFRGTPFIKVSTNMWSIWEGRLEDIAITEEGVSLTGLGYWRAYSDIPYTALYSSTDVKKFRPVLTVEWSDTFPDRYQFDTSHDYIQISPIKGSEVGNNGINNVVGRMAFELPDTASLTSGRNFVGCEFTYEYFAPTNWVAEGQMFTGNPGTSWSYTSSFWGPVSGTGSLQQGRVWVNSLSTPRLVFILYYAGGAGALASETGSIYLRIKNWRAVTSSDTQVYATTSAIIGTGANTSVPVDTTRYMYPGQKIILTGSGGTSQTTVVSVTNSTTVVIANSAAVQNAGALLLSSNVTSSDIVRKVLAHSLSYNPSQINSALAFVSESERDQTDVTYEDKLPAEIFTELAARGDNTVPPRKWEVGVYENQALFFRPRGSAGRQWYVDAEHIEIRRSLDHLTNSYYGIYQTPSGRVQRSTVNTDSFSVTKYGMTRQQAVQEDGTSSALAGINRDAALNDTKEINPQADIEILKLYDSTGQAWPLFAARSGDTITIRNIPPTLSSAIDKIRTFRISETSYDAMTRKLSVVPELPLPGLQRALSQQL